jgi:hypothetical protein
MNVSNFSFSRPPLDSNPFIIPEPDKLKETMKINNKTFLRYHIDSRDRGISVDPTPSKYTISLFDGIVNDVLSVELLTFNIPFSRYIVHDRNNTLHFTFSDSPSVEHFVKIVPGNYTQRELCEELHAELTPHSIGCAYVPNQEKCILSSSTNVFSLVIKGDSYTTADKMTHFLLKTDSICNVIGFAISDHGSSNDNASNNIIGSYPMNMDADSYIIMKLKGAKVFKSNNGNVDNCFAIIRNNILEVNNVTNPPIVMKSFNPPLASLNRISISFHDYNGNLYDFNNKDHTLELRFTVMKQGMRIE